MLKAIKGNERVVVGFKANVEERCKLQDLADRTQRTPSDVLRLLLRLAEPAPERDIRLAQPQPRPVEPAHG